jgi:hypothetical protein
VAIVDRMIRASKGEVGLYEEVEHDPGATIEAIIVVAVGALSSGIGNAIALAGQNRPGGNPIAGLLLGIISALIGWAVFAGVTYFIGKQLFKADATWEEVLRTLGYANSPSVGLILIGIPVLGGILGLALGIWGLYLAFVAIRAALDISTGQTIATILLAIIPSIIIIALLQAPFAIARI